MALAGAAEMTCDMRGLSVRIEYDEAGEVTVFDGEEVLAKAQADPIVVSETKASCVGDRFRLIRGGNVAQDGDHATLSVGTMEMDFGPLLDTLPAERFDPHKAGVRKARRSAAKGDFSAWTSTCSRCSRSRSRSGTPWWRCCCRRGLGPPWGEPGRSSRGATPPTAARRA